MIALLFFTSCPQTPESDDDDDKKTVIYKLTDVALAFGIDNPAVLTGTITVEIRNSEGDAPALSTLTVNTNTLTDGWNSFDMPDITVKPGSIYTIYVIRSDTSDYAGGNYITLINDLTDPYPNGASDYRDFADYTFRTFINSKLDQYFESLTGGGVAIVDSNYRWQEFTVKASIPYASTY